MRSFISPKQLTACIYTHLRPCENGFVYFLLQLDEKRYFRLQTLTKVCQILFDIDDKVVLGSNPVQQAAVVVQMRPTVFDTAQNFMVLGVGSLPAVASPRNNNSSGSDSKNSY